MTKKTICKSKNPCYTESVVNTIILQKCTLFCNRLFLCNVLPIISVVFTTVRFMRKISDLKRKLYITLMFVFLYIVLIERGMTCIFQKFLGIPCPGCGMTSAWLSLMELDIMNAFRLNPMFWSIPILYLFILYDGKLLKNKRMNNACLYIIAILYSIFYFYRLSQL